MEKLEHIGIAVKNMQDANKLFSNLLGREPYKVEEVVAERVRTSFFDIGGVKLELLEAIDGESPIARFIDKKGQGIHHLAFEVADMAESIRKYRALGFEVINEEPRKGADNKMVVFLHPHSTNGVLIELCQEIK